MDQKEKYKKDNSCINYTQVEEAASDFCDIQKDQ
jgi:hypothetical protein